MYSDLSVSACSVRSSHRHVSCAGYDDDLAGVTGMLHSIDWRLEVAGIMQLRFLLLLLIAMISLATIKAFGTSSRYAKGLKVPSTIRPRLAPSTREAPKMVVYWSIKSTFDIVQYAINPDIRKFKGTGVFNFIELSKDPEPKRDEKPDTKNGTKK